TMDKVYSWFSLVGSESFLGLTSVVCLSGSNMVTKGMKVKFSKLKVSSNLSPGFGDGSPSHTTTTYEVSSGPQVFIVRPINTILINISIHKAKKTGSKYGAISNKRKD